MAALIAAKRSIPLSKALRNLLSSPARPLAASGSSIARSFNTNAQIREPEDDRDLEVGRRSVGRFDGFPTHISDVMDPFVPRTVTQLLNMMDSMLEGPFQSPAARSSGGIRRGWDAREDADALYLRIDMPGLGKENVKVSAEQGTLLIRGEGEAEGGEESQRRYSTRIELAPEIYKLDSIRAEMKNGVLKVVVPKAKKEERKDVFNVDIE